MNNQTCASLTKPWLIFLLRSHACTSCKVTIFLSWLHSNARALPAMIRSSLSHSVRPHSPHKLLQQCLQSFPLAHHKPCLRFHYKVLASLFVRQRYRTCAALLYSWSSRWNPCRTIFARRVSYSSCCAANFAHLLQVILVHFLSAQQTLVHYVIVN